MKATKHVAAVKDAEIARLRTAVEALQSLARRCDYYAGGASAAYAEGLHRELRIAVLGVQVHQ